LLILTSFQKALTALDRALTEHARIPDNDFVRDACIQRFELTYELSHKMLKRHLEMTAASPSDIDHMTFQTLIRTGFEQGLLQQSWDHWKTYRTARGTTNHTYDAEKAKDVLAIIPTFYEDALFLYQKLQAHHDTNARIRAQSPRL